MRLRLLYSFVLSLFFTEAYSQNTFSEKVDYAYEKLSSDINGAKKLLSEINHSELESAPDTSLLDFHYVSAIIADEEGNIEEKISHLAMAKQLCETKLGIRQAVYVEIMNALADSYKDVGDDDKALEIYQEGIVKSLSIRNWEGAKDDFSYLNSGLALIYESKGWKTEVADMWMNAWGFWDKAAEPFEPANYFPLFMLHDYYYRQKEFDKALIVVDSICSYIENKVGTKHYTYGRIMYSKGNTLCRLGRYDEAKQIFLNGIEIVKDGDPDSENELKQLYGNFICESVTNGDLLQLGQSLKELKRICEESKDGSYYVKVLYNVSKRLRDIRKYDEALNYITIVLEKYIDLLSDTERPVIQELQQELSYRKENVVVLQNLLKTGEPKYVGTDEWFSYMNALANGYYVNQEYREAGNTLRRVYSVIKQSEGNQSEKLGEIIDLIVGCANQDGDDSTIVEFAPQWIAFAQQKFGTNSEQHYTSLQNASISNMKQNALEQAQQYLGLSFPLCEQLYGKNSYQYAISLHNQGRIKQLSNELDEALKLYKESLALMKALNVPQDVTRRTRQCLGEVELKIKERL